MSDIDNKLREYQEIIKGAEEVLLMIASSTPKDIVNREEGEIVSTIQITAKGNLELIKEYQEKIFTLEMLKEYVQENGFDKVIVG